MELAQTSPAWTLWFLIVWWTILSLSLYPPGHIFP